MVELYVVKSERPAKAPRVEYDQPGSFARVQEAAIALAECDTDDDAAYNRCVARLRDAVRAWRLSQ